MIKNDIDETVRLYFKSLENFKPLTKEEEHKLLIKYKKRGDIRARDKIIESNLKYTSKIANSYRDRGVDFSFLISEANDALIDAIDKFDIKQDVKLMSYAKWWIMQRMQSVTEKKNKIKTSDLPEENNTTLLDDFDDENMTTQDYFKKSDVFADEFDDEYENENKHKFITEITEGLNDREREMIAMYYGLITGEECTLEDIGLKYNLTKERVRQIMETGFRKIRSKSILLDSQYISR